MRFEVGVVGIPAIVFGIPAFGCGMDPFGFCGEPVGIYFGVKNECVQVCAMAFAIECRLGVCICRISFFGFAFCVCDEYSVVVGDVCKGETIFFALAKIFQFVFLG